MSLEFAHGTFQVLSSASVGTTYTVSGLPFQPKALRFWTHGLASTTDALTGTQNWWRAAGFAKSTTDRRCVATFSQHGAGNAATRTGMTTAAALGFADPIGTTFARLALDVDAILSDGFRMILDAINLTVSPVICWEAIGGSDIDAANVTIGACDEPAATGTQSYTATGFVSGTSTDQIVFFAGVEYSGTGGVASDDSNFMIGVTDGTNSWVVLGNSDSGSANMETDGYCRSGQCLAKIANGGGNPNSAASFSAWATNAFVLDWGARATTGRRNIYLAIKGGAWKVGTLTINGNTLNATAAVSGLAFTPVGVLVAGTMTAEDSVGVSHNNDRMAFGHGSSTSSRRTQGGLDEDTLASSEINLTVQYDQVLAYPSATATLQTAYDISAVAADGFTLITDVAGGVASEWIGYVTFGSATGGGPVTVEADGAASGVGTATGVSTPTAGVVGAAPSAATDNVRGAALWRVAAAATGVATDGVASGRVVPSIGAAAGTSGGPEQVDQQQTTTTGQIGFMGGTASSGETDQALGQSFVPGFAQSLVGIEVIVEKFGTQTDPLRMKLYSGSMGGTLVATSSDVSIDAKGSYRFTFSSAPALAASTTYYFSIERTGARDGNFYALDAAPDLTYAHGVLYKRDNNVWSVVP